MTSVEHVQRTAVIVRPTENRVVVREGAGVIVRPERVQIIGQPLAHIRAGGVVGPPGPVGPMGPAGPGDKTFDFEQLTASATWTIDHNLNKFPSCEMHDDSGRYLIGNVTWPSPNRIIVYFGVPIAGRAHLN